MQYDEIGKYIRKKRKLIAKSLNSFAIDCDVEPATLSNFENKKSDIYFKNLLKIIDGFGQTPAEFFQEFQNYK